jgi:hypothetical protein
LGRMLSLGAYDMRGSRGLYVGLGASATHADGGSGLYSGPIYPEAAGRGRAGPPSTPRGEGLRDGARPPVSTMLAPGEVPCRFAAGGFILGF